MWVVSLKRLREFWGRHPLAEVPLRAWFTQTSAAEWSNFSDLRRTFPSADLVGNCTVLNVGGNKYRLIARSSLHKPQSVCVARDDTCRIRPRGLAQAMRVLPAAAQTRQARRGDPQIESTLKTEAGIVIRMKTPRRSTAIPDTYFALVKRHPLRSIRNELELDAAQAAVDALLREDLDDGGLIYLDALSDLVIVYEQDHHAVTPLPPHELLAHMLEERNMSQADLARQTGLAKATVSDLATGKRRFTVQQMHTVASVFGLPGAVFMPKNTTR